MVFWGMGDASALSEIQRAVQEIFSPRMFHALVAPIDGIAWSQYAIQVELANEEVELLIPGITGTRQWQAYCDDLANPGRREQRRQLVTA